MATDKNLLNNVNPFFLKTLNLTQKQPTPIVNMNIDLVYANGDSWSYGSELGDESIEYRYKFGYPGLIAQHYNVPLVNNSKPGGSNQRTFRTSLHDISRLIIENKKPLVVLTWTEVHRFELFDVEKNDWVSFANPQSSTDENLSNIVWSKYYTDISGLTELITKFIAIDSFFKYNQIPYIMVNCAGVTSEFLSRNFTNEEISFHKTVLDKTNYISQFTLSNYLRTFNRISWGARGHPLEDGQQIISDFLLLQIKDRYNITANET